MLTNTKVQKSKPCDKPRKLFDGNGLYLLIQPNGGRWWRFKYRFAGKERLLSFGTYPEVSLADARDKRNAARKLVAAGIDPSEQRRAEKEASGATFELVAREWFEKFKAQWVPTHAITVISRMERDLFPHIGNKVVREITAPNLLDALRRIERRGANETARRVRQICGQVFRYAIATGRADVTLQPTFAAPWRP